MRWTNPTIIIAATFVAIAALATRDVPSANAVLDMTNIGPWQMQVTDKSAVAWRINTLTGAMSYCFGAAVVRCFEEK